MVAQCQPMSLAVRLNQLAAANDEGLLNDDEYRILRHSLFEQHHSTLVLPVEAPLVSIASNPQPKHPSVSHPTPPPSPPASQLHPSPSLSSSFSSLFRRALTLRRKPHRTSAPLPTPSQPVALDDESITSSADIRAAITATYEELRRIMDAFNALESSIKLRTHSHPLPRSSSSPTSLRQQPLSSKRHPLRVSTDPSEVASIHSASSVVTNVTLSSAPYLAPHVRTPSIQLHRNSSVSSISSRSLSLPSPIVTRSTGYLPLSIRSEASSDEEPELTQIRSRRQEVASRYATRLQYLRAKLKGAELHEKLMRK